MAGASGDDEVKWSSSSWSSSSSSSWSVNRRPWQDDERIHCALFRGQRQSDAFSRVLMRRWRLSMGGRALFGRGADAMGIEFGFAVVAPVRVVGMAFLRVSSNWRWRRRLPPPPFLAFGDLIAESRLGYGLVSPFAVPIGRRRSHWWRARRCPSNRGGPPPPPFEAERPFPPARTVGRPERKREMLVARPIGFGRGVFVCVAFWWRDANSEKVVGAEFHPLWNRKRMLEFLLEALKCVKKDVKPNTKSI